MSVSRGLLTIALVVCFHGSTAAAEPAIPEPSRLDCGHTVAALAFSPDGKTLATASEDRSILLWSVETAKEIGTLQGHDEGVRCQAFSPDGKTLASGSFDGSVRTWDVATRQEQRQLSVGHNPWGLAFVAGGKHLAVGGSFEKRIALYDLSDGKELRSWGGERAIILSIIAAPDGKTLASAGDDDSVRFWDPATGKETRRLAGHDDRAWTLAVSADGRWLASAGKGGSLRLSDAVTGRRLPAFPGHDSEIWSVALTPDGRILASAGDDHTLRLWDTATGREMHRFTAPERVNAVAFTPDGGALAWASGNGVYLLGKTSTWLPGLRKPVEPPSAAALDALWLDLASDKMPVHARASWEFVIAPGQSLPYIDARLKPPAPEVVERLLAELDSPRFAARDKACRELEALGKTIEPGLKRVLTNGPPLELRRRVEQLLEKLAQRGPNADWRRVQRSLEIVEEIGSPAARKLVEGLTRGSEQSALTREARAALERIDNQAK